MTRYEACCKLKEWGLEQLGNNWVGNDGTIGNLNYSLDFPEREPVAISPLESLLAFAESIAEKNWPGKWRRGLLHTVSMMTTNGVFEAYVEVQHKDVYGCCNQGTSNESDWWAVYNLIAEMMEE